jgi:hypothetical protein
MFAQNWGGHHDENDFAVITSKTDGVVRGLVYKGVNFVPETDDHKIDCPECTETDQPDFSGNG